MMPTSRRHLALYGLLAAAAAAAIVFGLNDVYGFLNSSSPTAGSQRTATVARGTVQASVSASGNVGVAESASANFPSSGTLTAVDVSVGQHVKAGQVLAKVDPTDAENTLMAAQANLEQAESTLATEKAGLTASQQAANTASLQQAQMTVTTDEQQLATDQSTLATAKAQLASDRALSCPASSSSTSALSASSNASSSSGEAGANGSTGSGAASTGSTAGQSGSTGTSGSGSSFAGGTGANSSGSGSTGTGSTGAGSTGTGSTGTGSTGTGSTGTGSTGIGSANRTTQAVDNGSDASGTPSQTTTTSAPGATGSSGTTTTGSSGSGTGTEGSGQSGTSVGSASGASTTTPAVTGQAGSVGVTTATLSGSVDPAGTDTTYWFEYGTSPTSLSASTAKLDAGSGSQAVPVSASVSGLSADQTYLFRLVASTASATTDGALESFTTSAPDFATTGQASSVGPTTATLGGDVNPSGLATTYFFQYGLSPSALSARTASHGAGSGSDVVPVSVAVSGLRPNVNYLFRLVARNSAGTADGALELFRTSGVVQSATTGAATQVGSTTVTLSGTVDPGGLATRYRFAYGTSATALSRTTATIDAGSGTAALPVTATIDGLKPDTDYLFELVAQNASGTSTGAEASFTTTAAAVPSVTTGSATDELTSVVTLTGTVDPNGSDTHYWFEYGTTSGYGKRTPATDDGSGTTATEVTATVSGLKSNTEYLFRLVATSAVGSSVGIGEVAKTAESSCVTDAQTVTSDEQAVARQAATVTAAEDSLTQTEATIAASETPSASTLAADEATVAQDEATVAADKKAVAETTLTSPISGVVTAVNDSVGETVGGSGSSVTNATSAAASSSSTGSSGFAGTSSSSSGASSSSSGFISIDSLDRLEIVAGFPEADAIKIAVGQPATITFPALPETEVAGKVIAVSSTSTVVSNVVTYNETIALVNPPSEVKEGMTADVSVVDQSASGVMELPTSAITTTGTRSTVELLQNGKTTVTPIVTGLVGNSSTQVVSGLKVGDVVVEPTVTISAASSSTSTTSGFAGVGGGGFAGLGGGGGAGGFTGGGFTRGG